MKFYIFNSYYPLHPTHEDVNLDYEHFESHAHMPITPDVLVVPSDLRYFVKVILTFKKTVGCLIWIDICGIKVLRYLFFNFLQKIIL